MEVGRWWRQRDAPGPTKTGREIQAAMVSSPRGTWPVAEAGSTSKRRMACIALRRATPRMICLAENDTAPPFPRPGKPYVICRSPGSYCRPPSSRDASRLSINRPSLPCSFGRMAAVGQGGSTARSVCRATARCKEAVFRLMQRESARVSNMIVCTSTLRSRATRKGV